MHTYTYVYKYVIYIVHIQHVLLINSYENIHIYIYIYYIYTVHTLMVEEAATAGGQLLELQIRK